MRAIVERQQIRLGRFEQPVVFFLDGNFARGDVVRIGDASEFFVAFLLEAAEFSADGSELAEEALPGPVAADFIDGVEKIPLPFGAAGINSRGGADGFEAVAIAIVDAAEIGASAALVDRADALDVVVGDDFAGVPRRLGSGRLIFFCRRGGRRDRRSRRSGLLRRRRGRLVLSARAGCGGAQQQDENANVNRPAHQPKLLLLQF